MKILLHGIFIIFVLTGCGTVVSKITVFHTLPKLDVNNSLTYKFEKSTGQENNLEYENYKIRTQYHLNKSYCIYNEKAKNLIKINYGVDNGNERQYSAPVMGVVNTNQKGIVSYGVVGSETYTEKIYRRFFTLSITDEETNRLIYDGRVVSEGSSSELLSVIDEMIESLFKDFPGTNGKTNTVKVPYKE